MGANQLPRFLANSFSTPIDMKPEFDAVHTPLERGFTVIEASAGTGKTTTISAIVLRLIAEHGIPIEKILVTTYTDALSFSPRQARHLPFVAEIVEKIADRQQLQRRLELALRNFDEAPIFTIHGFCARVLTDRAFESGALFDMELITDQSQFLHEIVDDFWRVHFYTGDAMMAASLRDQLRPAKLVELLNQVTNNPTLRVLPPPEDRAALRIQLAELHQTNPDSNEAAELKQRFSVSLQAEFCQWAIDELRRRKADRRVQSFDDMLTRVDEALRGETGDEFRGSLRARFPVALIDEFQDTDPVQYSIFSQIYRGSDASVFFIGDPKQAIYGFRGADVFTYLQAAKVAARSYTLENNWRSEAKLVEGVNEIFDQRDDAFVIEGIKLVPVTAADECELLTINGRSDQPLRFWIASAEERNRVPQVVAAAVAQLLASDAKIGAKRIEPRDIAVLVNTNLQPVEIQGALSGYGIPSVVYSAASVFRSTEAEELLHVLLGVAQPNREKIVRAALATELLGRRVSELENLSNNEVRWDNELNLFAGYHTLWRDEGFVKMMRTLLVQEKVRARLLCLRDGKRRLTNVLHLIELLHAACAENRFGIDGLIDWLRRQISAERVEKEQHELRLESDEDAVHIVTIHKSKGLEYGVTFYPFVRKDPWRARNDFLKFHDDDALALDLAETPEHEKIRNREELAELVRQFYVAATRARNRSYLVWQESTRKSKSGPAWLFSSATSAEAFTSAGVSAAETSRALRSIAGNSIAVEPLPEIAAPRFSGPLQQKQNLQPRAFGSEIDRSWGISSFSSLISGRMREPESPDYDSDDVESEPAFETPIPASGIHAFPRGTRAGTCLHLILEELDFANPVGLRELASEKLRLFGIEGFDDTIFDAISQALDVPLGQSGLRLSQITQAARLSELEFLFPITDLIAARLQAALNTSEFPPTIGRLQFSPANGFIKGFIDLVVEQAGKFYVIDWKSNCLGPDTASYAPENIVAEIARHFYTLQLSIYTVALHRYLRQRLRDYRYEEHFGGVFYIFLRGIDPADPRSGIFQTRPSAAFIEELDRILHGER
jgi:exodeoxyribonuclease V beta subunit